MEEAGRRRRQGEEGGLGRRGQQGRRSHARRRTRRRVEGVPGRHAGGPRRRGSPRCGSTRAWCAARRARPSSRRTVAQAVVDPGRRGRDRQADPSLRRAVAASAADRLDARLKDAGKAFRRERFEEARGLLRAPRRAGPHGGVGPRAPRPHLLPARPLEAGRHRARGVPRPHRQHRAAPGAGRLLPGARPPRQGRASCGRSCERRRPAPRSWPRAASCTPASLADQGRLDDAIARARGRASRPAKRPQEHHLRVAYALADLYERAGDVPKARQLFRIVAAADPELGDVEARLAAALAARRRFATLRRRRAPAELRQPGAARCHTPRTVGCLPPPRPLTAPSEAPMSSTPVPARGDQPVRPRRHPAAARAERRDAPVGRRASLALEVTVRARRAARRVRPRRRGSARRPRPPAWRRRRGGVVVGRVRRRFFRAGGVTQSRTEVVADRGRPARPRAGGALVGEALGAADQAVSPGGCDGRARVRHDGAGTARSRRGSERTMNQQQLEKVRDGKGFIAALDQSGGSTPEGAEALRHRRGRRTRATTRCSTASTRCAPGSSPARASTATASSARSSSRRRWTAQIEGRDTGRLPLVGQERRARS